MKTNHNQYVSTPNWFSSIKEEVKQTKPVIQQTVYYGSGSNSNNNGISSLSIYNKAVYKEDTLQLSDLSIAGYAVIAIQKKEEDNAGELTVNDVWSSSLFIPVVGGSEITINTSYDSTFTYGIAFYDIQKKYISGNHTVQELIQTVTVPANAVYFRICSLSVYEEFNVKYQGLSNYSYKQLTDIYGKGLDPFTSIDDSFEYLYSSTFTSDKISFVADYPLKLEIDSDNNIHFNINDLLLSGVFVTTSEEEQDIEGIKIFKNGLGIGDFLLVPDKTNNSIKLIHKNELIEKESNTYFGNMYVTGWFSALGMSPGGIGPSFGGSNNLFELNDVSAVYNEQGIPYAVLGTTGENTVGKVLTWDGSKWYADESLNSAKGDERYLLKKIFSKIFTAYNEKGEIIDITDYDSVIDNVSINYSLWSTGFISAYGISKGDSNPTALYQLADVLSENNEVQGAVIGSVLTYNGTHWYASKLDIDSNIDTNDILNILEQYNYLTKDKAEELFLTKNQADDAYLLKQVFKNIFTAYDANDNEVDICDISANINNIKINYGFWSNGFISALGKQLTEPSSATALYQLVDVLANETNTGVKYAKKGSVLTFDGTHWVAGVINTDDGMIDEAAVMEIIERYNYLDQTEGDKRYLQNNLFLKIFTAYDKQGNEVALSSNTIDNIKVNYNFWSDGYLSSRGISDDIIDAIDFIEVDEKTISKRNGYLEVIGGVGNSGVTDYNDLDNLPDLTIYALKDSLDGYLPLAGGTITGDLRLRAGTEYTSPYLYFGDSDEVWLKKVTDTQLTIHADGSVKIDSPKTVIDGIEIKKSASGVLFIDANLVVSGGITMYGTDGTTANTIWDDAPIASTSVKGIASFDSNFFAVNNGKVTFIGSTGGGGIDSITKQMVIDALGFTPYDEDNPDGFITGITKSMVTTALGYTPYNSTNPSGYITGITKSMVTTALGFTPYNATNPNGYITSSGSITGNAATATTASKLSTVSKTAWGQTYWTSGGVPTDISGNMSSVGNILSSGTNTYELGSSSNKWKSVHANCLSFGNEVNARLTTKGWYRFAVGGDENEYGGSFIFFIRRSYNNVKTESFVISATVGYGRVVFNQLSGAVSGSLITKVRATNYADNVIYFDLYYEGSTNGHVVYVNAVGDVTIQTPTSVSSAYSYTTEFTLGDGMVTGKALTCFDYKGLAYIRQNFGKNLLTNGDNYAGSTNYGFANYTYDESVTNGRTYRLTICGKLGEGTSYIYAYWDGGSGNNTYIGGLSSKEERVVTITAKITNKQKLVFFQFNSNNQSAQGSYSYIRWAYLEEAYNEGELSTTTDYNNWLTEYNKLDARSFLYKIQRIDVGDSSYWSADKGLNLIDANAYALTVKRTASSGGTFIKMMANNQSTQSWASGVNNAHQFSWWYQNGTSDVQKMKLDNTGSLSSDYWKLVNSSTNPYLMLTQGSTWYIQGFEGYLYLGAGSAKSMRIDSSGNVLSAGGITMYSDLRKKTILNHVELSLKEVADAPLIEHYYNSDESKCTHVGSVAQYWAGLNDWFCKEDGEGFLTMEIQNAALASAISVARELTRYESKTDKQIKKLKKRIGELEEEIENLKKV